MHISDFENCLYMGSDVYMHDGETNLYFLLDIYMCKCMWMTIWCNYAHATYGILVQLCIWHICLHNVLAFFS